jgi:hypothetical protein
MKVPPTISCAGRDMVMLSSGEILLDLHSIRSTEAAKFPEMVIQNNVNTIREAALTTLRCLLITTNHMQLFSFDELYSEALNQLEQRTKELEDGLLSELPDIQVDEPAGLITLVGQSTTTDDERDCTEQADWDDPEWIDDTYD